MEALPKTLKGLMRKAHVFEQASNNLIGAVNAHSKLSQNLVECCNEVQKDMAHCMTLCRSDLPMKAQEQVGKVCTAAGNTTKLRQKEEPAALVSELIAQKLVEMLAKSIVEQDTSVGSGTLRGASALVNINQVSSLEGQVLLTLEIALSNEGMAQSSKIVSETVVDTRQKPQKAWA